MDDILLAPPTADPVSLAEAKDQIREDTNDSGQEDLINSNIKTSTEEAEDYLSRALINQKRALFMNCFPGCIETMRSPLIKVESIQYYDTNDTLQTLATTVYQVAKHGERAKITPKSGQYWPLTESKPHAVQVNYYAGYSTPFTADDTTDVITANDHGKLNGDIVRLWNTGGELPTGLSANVNYFVIDATANTFKVSLTSGGSAVDITAAGTGTNFAGHMPEKIKQYILWMSAHKYENREASTTESVKELPFGPDQLLGSLTVTRF